MSQTGRFEIGAARSRERRTAEVSAVADAWLEIAVGKVKAELESGWLGPENSPLGPDRHRAAVEARIARRAAAGEGPVDAAIIAGRHMLSLDALADEYFRPDPVETRLTRVVRVLGLARPRNDRGARR